MHMQDIPDRAKDRPFAFEASGYYYNEEGHTNSVYAYVEEFNGNTDSQKDALSDEFNSFHVAHETVIPSNTQVAVLDRFQGIGLMMIDTHHNIVERWRYMTVLFLMDILAGKQIKSTSNVWRLHQLIYQNIW